MSNTVFITSGLNSARTLSALTAAGLRIERVDKTQNSLMFHISSRKEKKAAKVLKNLRLEYSVQQKKSLIEGVFSVKRIGLLCGIVVSVAIFLFISTFISKIDIKGLQLVSESEVRTYLFEEGIVNGISKRAIDTKKIENGLLSKFGFSFTQVSIKGIALKISVKEELPSPYYYSATEPKPLLAKENATISRLVCVRGTPEIKVGESVKKGDVLIGAYKQLGEEVLPVRALGEVYGRVWYTQEIFIPAEAVVFEDTGKIEEFYFMSFGSAEAARPPSTFTYWRSEVTEMPLSAFLPLYRNRLVYREQRAVIIKNPKLVSYEDEINEAKKKLSLSCAESEGEFIRSWTKERTAEDGIYIKVFAEFEKRIDIFPENQA